MNRRSSRAVWRRVQAALVALVLVTTGVFAVRADGFAVKKLELNDTGIWISNDADGFYGRLNKRALGLDATAGPPGQRLARYELDILQDGALVAGWDRTGGKLTVLDPRTVTNVVDNAVSLAPGTQVQLRGGTLAAMDRSGKVWATRYAATDTLLDVRALDPAQEPVADLKLPAEAPEGTAALAVGVDGTVWAGTIAGKVLKLAPDAAGLAKPVEVTLATSVLKTIQLAAVGTQIVALDAEAGRVHLEGGKTASVAADPLAKVQESGPATASVLVASSKDFERVDLANATVTRIDSSGDGTPARPVHLGGCDFAAWAGTGRYTQACAGAAVVAEKVDRTGGLTRPVWRINHGLITLNDQANGRAFDPEIKSSLDNWKDVRPQAADAQAEKSKQTNQGDAKPKVGPDDLKARPDRTTVLHVLDNDTDTAGGVLMIKKVDGVAPQVKVDIAPDGQTLKLLLPRDVATTTFRYTVSNGTNTAEGTVTITNAGTTNSPPELRAGMTTPVYTVASYGNLSIPVTGDWRDAEGDPVAVTAAFDGDTVVPITADGRLEYTAAPAESTETRTIRYEVTDGIDATTKPGQVTVSVLPRGESRSTPPVAQPDAAQGEVGKPITISPLANDTPGADPRNTQARLVLGQPVATKPDLDVQTDLASGRVVVTGAKEGTYFLEYQAGYGSSAFSTGLIRVDVAAAGGPGLPVAMPDQAAVRGQGAVLVDVLANDHDPAGALLTVQAVTPQQPDQVQAAVIAGRWLRIVPQVDHFAPNPQVVRYTVSNGGQSTTGDVIVTQLAGADDDRPLVRDDAATVRDGDSTLIGVLANDTSLTGAPLTLATNNQGVDSAGRLKVIDPAKRADEDQGDVGLAFAHNNQIRYVAPAKVEAAKQVQIEYVAATASGNTGVGRVTVTINPQPATPEANQAPVPQPVEMRLVSGSRVSIPIPTSGADPDGDSVTVTGITSAPALGRVLSFSPHGVTYEAYPTSGLVGTDTFTYEVTDRYGRSGRASVRVAVVAPGQTQPPVAIDDTLVARPGAKVQVNVLGNDLVSRDDSIVVAPLATLNTALPPDVVLANERGPITAIAPGPDAQPINVLYALTGNGGTGPSASVKITAKEGYRNPPMISDQTAIIDGQSASVDVLANAWDPDGDLAALKVDLLATPAGASLVGGKVTVPLLAHPQVIPFRVTDADGASNGAVVYVPAAGSGAPTLKPGGLITMGQNETVTLSLADYVTSPRNKQVRIASAALVATPTINLAASPVDPGTFTLTSSNDYVGPGAVVIEVMDAESQTAPDVLKATLSIPVQVGPKTPVLRCPTDPQVLVQGGEAKSLDITSLCHVWAPDPATLAAATYTATWSQPIAEVSAQGGRKVTLQAGSRALENSIGSVTVGIEGTPAKTAELPVKVLEAAPPTMKAQTLTDIKQGTPVTVQLGLKSPLLKPEPTVIDVHQVSGPKATWTQNGMALVITPDATVSGTIVLSVTASDLPDRPNRQITRTITLVVYGRPDAPSAPIPGQTVQSRSVALSWAPPKSNGAPIDQYKVKASTGKEWTFQSTSGNLTGLVNDQAVTFQVQAHNKGGWSDWSNASRSVTPDELPGAVTGVTASNPQDGTLTLSWGAPSNAGSAVQKISIAWQGGTKDLAGNPTSTTIAGLNNNTKYTFTVWATNKLGPGPNASGTGQSSGKPLGLAVNAPAPLANVGATTQVRVSWKAADPNGPGPVTYSAKRSDGKQICSNTTATSCTDDTVTFDGTSYTYTVTAVNATGEPHSSTATSPAWKATGTPDNWGTWTAVPTGSNGEVKLAYTVPPSRGATSTVTLQGASGALPTSSPGGGAATAIVGGLTNGRSYALSLKVCNESNACKVSSTVNVTPFGPLTSPSVSASLSGNVANFTANANGNGAPATLTVRSTRTGATWTTSGTGALSLSNGQDIGYSASTAYEATLSTGATTPARSNPPGVTSNTVTTPAPPRTVTIRRSTTQFKTGCTYHGGGPCPYVEVTTSGFTGKYTCDAATNGSSWNVPVSWTGDKTWEPYWYNGFAGTVTVTCAGVASNGINW